MTTVNSVNTYIVATATNEVTMPLQPAFGAYIVANDLNVTGNDTLYTVGTNQAWTETFDQNADFNVNGTITAPVTGRYQISTTVRMDGYVAANTSYIIINTSNGDYNVSNTNGLALINNTGTLSQGGSIFADMDAADTAVVQVLVNGEGADIIDLVSINRQIFFGAALIC